MNFRSFSDFTVSFTEDGAYLVGPNNAGKSTILTAIRTADVLLRYSYARSATLSVSFDDRSLTAYPLSLTEFPALRDSVRHEFGNETARIELSWRSGARLVAVWPAEGEDGDSQPYFFLEKQPGMLVRTPVGAREAFPPLGVIPILSPLEHTETALTKTYVARNVSGRLSSRHFRNQLRVLSEDQQLDAFLEWATPWLGDISLDRLGQHFANGEMVLEAFYYEAGSRIPKEVVWAGDGLQVWLQLLYHVHRVSHLNTIVLDEPDVYLHPDLQRRLVHLLESTGRQVILATHSAEMLAEADTRLVTLIDKSRRHARRARSDGDLEMLSSTLGTAFNLRLARALRSKVALFVEGQDMVVLRRFAKTLALTELEAERGISVIQLQGYTRWGQVEPFSYLCTELLPSALKIFIILDRDYRSDEVVAEVEASFAAAKLDVHVWLRKELESYLLTPSVISRMSGAPLAKVNAWLSAITLNMGTDVFARSLSERLRSEVSGGRHNVTVMTSYKTEFDGFWSDEEYRLRTCPPKEIISALNSRLQSEGLKAVSVSSLARAHRLAEIPVEIAKVLRAVEHAIGS